MVIPDAEKDARSVAKEIAAWAASHYGKGQYVHLDPQCCCLQAWFLYSRLAAAVKHVP